MIIQQLLFYLFAAFAILAATMVVVSKNSVQAVLYLVLTFFNMAAIWMLLESEFLAIVLVLVYVGAVMVLFLFVVMMLDMEVSNLRQQIFTKNWPIGLVVAAVLLTLMVLVVDKHFNLNWVLVPAQAPSHYSDVKALGSLLYCEYLLPFEIAGVILLVAMIVAISLTYRGPRNTKSQKPAQQIQVRKTDRLTIVKMPSEQGDTV